MPKSISKSERLDTLEQSVIFRMNRLHALFQLFGSRDFFPSIDKQGRLYTPFTMLPEPIRYFITYQGAPLASADIRNSQPFHLCYLFEPRFWSNKAHRLSLKSILPLVYGSLDKTGVLLQIRKLVGKVHNGSDVRQYIEMTSDGVFYEALVERYGVKYKTLSTRNRAKQRFMRFLFFNPKFKDVHQYDDYREWATDFPNVVYMLELIKQNNHSFLARVLQSIEAKLLLQLVAGEFTKQHPGVFITSIHDSLITFESKIKELETIIRRVYRREIGLEPQIEVKRLNPETAHIELPTYIQKKLASIK